MFEQLAGAQFVAITDVPLNVTTGAGGARAMGGMVCQGTHRTHACRNTSLPSEVALTTPVF